MVMTNGLETTTTILKWKHSTKWSEVKKDTMVLEKWARLEIDTPECIDLLAKHNGWTGKVSNDDFIAWIGSMGWIRGMIIENDRETPVV